MIRELSHVTADKIRMRVDIFVTELHGGREEGRHRRVGVLRETHIRVQSKLYILLQ